MGKILVFDIGGTALKAALMNESKEILEREERETPKESLQELLDTIREIYEKYQSEAEGISFSMPGIIDCEKGYIHMGGALTYNRGCEFRRLVEEVCKTKVVIENDAKCALLAEMWCGSLSDVDDGIVLILGTGVGGGIMLNRRLVKGTHFAAGEVSHCCMDYHRYGQNDAIAGRHCSTWGLVEMAKQALHTEEMDGRRFFAMLEEGNAALEKVFEEYCYSVAVLVFNLQATLDVQRVSFGGGISRQLRLIACIREQLDSLYAHEMIQKYSPALPKPEITVCRYFNDSNLIGALYSYIQRKDGVNCNS